MRSLHSGTWHAELLWKRRTSVLRKGLSPALLTHVRSLQRTNTGREYRARTSPAHTHTNARARVSNLPKMLFASENCWWTFSGNLKGLPTAKLFLCSTEMYNGVGYDLAPGALYVRVLWRGVRWRRLPWKGWQSVLQVSLHLFVVLKTDLQTIKLAWNEIQIALCVFLREDYFSMFAPKCGGCSRPIMDNYISALNRQWHPECFVCMVSLAMLPVSNSELNRILFLFERKEKQRAVRKSCKSRQNHCCEFAINGPNCWSMRSWKEVLRFLFLSQLSDKKRSRSCQGKRNGVRSKQDLLSTAHVEQIHIPEKCFSVPDTGVLCSL